MKMLGRSLSAPVEVLYTGQEPMVPVDFKPTAGVLIWRQEHNVAHLWDGRTYLRMNVAGWYCQFDRQFPMLVKVGHWAVLAPLPLAPAAGADPAEIKMDLSREELQWAFRGIFPQPEKPVGVSDQKDMGQKADNLVMPTPPPTFVET